MRPSNGSVLLLAAKIGRPIDLQKQRVPITERSGRIQLAEFPLANLALFQGTASAEPSRAPLQGLDLSKRPPREERGHRAVRHEIRDGVGRERKTSSREPVGRYLAFPLCPGRVLIIFSLFETHTQ